MTPEWLWRPWARARYGPECGARPPWRLVDARPCCIRDRAGHLGRTDGWHADGTGFIWNDELGRWQWNGPVVDLSEELRRGAEELPHGGVAARFEGVDLG